MKKLLLIAALLFSSAAFAQQGSVVRGEVSAGVYENIKSDGSQHLQVSVTGNTTPAIGVTYTPTSVSVTTSTTVVLTSNASRRYLQIQNQDATNPIWIRCDGTAATADGTGVKILAAQTWAPFIPPVGACNGISTGGTVVTGIIQGQ